MASIRGGRQWASNFLLRWGQWFPEWVFIADTNTMSLSSSEASFIPEKWRKAWAVYLLQEEQQTGAGILPAVMTLEDPWCTRRQVMAKEIHFTESAISVPQFIQMSLCRDSLIMNEARKLLEELELDHY